MSKPSIVNITTTQTFQNWFDKTNEMVDIMRDSAVTASVLGDTTVGDAFLTGEFTANTVSVTDDLRVDSVESFTAGEPTTFNSPINVIGTTSPIAATFTFGASGAKTRYTDTTIAWDVGFDNSTDTNFQIRQGTGEPQFSLSPAGVLTVPSVVAEADITIGSDLTVSGVLTANTLVVTSATGTFDGTLSGNFTGDIYHPGGNKVFENGGPAANIPATFTGNVLGTVSSLTNHNTNSLAEGTSNLYFTTARARASLSGSTGVTYSSTTGAISIGQSVGTSANVEFGDIEADDITCATVTATGTIDADEFTGDGSKLTGIVQLVRAHVTFTPSNGAVLASGGGLTVVRNATGRWTVTIPSSIQGGRPTSATGYSILVGGVSDKVSSLSQAINRNNAIRDYNAYVQSQTTSSFQIRATRSTNSYVHFGGNDNNTGSIFGITAVDPATPITIAVMY